MRKVARQFLASSKNNLNFHYLYKHFKKIKAKQEQLIRRCSVPSQVVFFPFSNPFLFCAPSLPSSPSFALLLPKRRILNKRSWKMAPALQVTL